MKKMLVLGCVIGVIATAKGVTAEDSSNPYQGIVDRNVFALKPPTPPPAPTENRPPPPKITLTGITTILGKKLVLLKVAPPPRPGVKNEEESLTLTVGQRQGEIEVLDIDEKNGIVKVNDYGTITNLNWNDNGIKMATPAPAAAPGAPGAPATATPFAPGGPVAPGGRTVPTFRPPRPGQYPGSTGVGSAGYPGGNTGYPAGGTALSGLGGPASQINGSKNWPPENLDPDHQVLLDAVYKQKNAQAIANGTMPDVPGDNPLINTPNNNVPSQQQNSNPNLRRAPSLPQVPPY